MKRFGKRPLESAVDWGLQEEYHDRECRKSAGHLAMREAATIDDRRAGCLEVIRAHFERSLRDWTRGSQRAQHGTFAQFAASWLWANGDRLVKEPTLLALLRSEFPKPRKPRIAMGRSYWGTL